MHLVNVIDFLKQTDELKVAKDVLKTFAKYACSLEQYDELGMLFEKIKAYPESLEMLEKCYKNASEPSQLYSIRSNFAKVYNCLNEPLKSLHYSSANLEINPLDINLKLEQSLSYYLYGDHQKSWTIQTNLLNDKTLPKDIQDRINFNIGTFDLNNGLFKQGLKKIIVNGKNIGLWPSIKKPFKKWNGEKTNKTLLVYAEAGIGDQIINVRFMDTLKKQNINAIWIGGDGSIRNVIKFSGYNVMDNDQALKVGDEYVYTDSFSLVPLLDLDLPELWNGTYLKLSADHIEKWKSLLPKKFITIRWSGNPLYEHNLHRNLPFDLLMRQIKKVIPSDVSIVSLQVDDNKHFDEKLLHVDIMDWFDTTAIQSLSLLNITSCTSTAHSAGAIGANCVVLPPISTYYPWCCLKENNTSYWYGNNLKVFVQTKWKNWDDPINLVINELTNIGH